MAYYSNGRVPSASPYAREALGDPRYPDMTGQIARIEQAKRLPNLAKRLALTGVGAAATAGLAPVLGSMFTGGAPVSGVMPAGAATSPAAASVTAAAKTGLGARLASIFSNPVTGVAINAATAYGANRSQNTATEQARRDTLAANAEALAQERQRLEMEMTNANLDRDDARAAQAALNELKKRELDASEEVRAFDREQAMYVRSKDEASEARRAPYREAGTKALARLNAIWGL